MRTYAAASVLIAGLLAIASPAWAVKFCDERLGNTVYACEVKSDALPFSAALRFDQGPFQLLMTGLAVVMDCVCDPQGPFANPTFNENPSRWTCVGSDPAGLTLT